MFVASLPFPTEIVIFRLLECIFFSAGKMAANEQRPRACCRFICMADDSVAIPQMEKIFVLAAVLSQVHGSWSSSGFRIPDSGEDLKKKATAAGKTTSWMSVMAPDGHKLRIFVFFFDQQTDRCVDAFAFHLWSLLLRIQSLHNNKKKEPTAETRRKEEKIVECRQVLMLSDTDVQTFFFFQKKNYRGVQWKGSYL